MSLELQLTGKIELVEFDENNNEISRSEIDPETVLKLVIHAIDVGLENMMDELKNEEPNEQDT